MLNIFREGAKTWAIKLLIWLVALTFVGAAFLVWAREDTPGVEPVAKVYGKVITKEKLAERTRRVEEVFNLQFKDSISPDIIKALKPKTVAFKSLVDDVLLERAAEKAGLAVADTEVARAIESMGQFKTAAGMFDRNAYLQYLSRISSSPKIFEETVRNEILRAKLRMTVENAAKISDVEAWASYFHDNQPVVVDYVHISASALEPKVEVTDDGLKKWFADHKDTFMIPESRVFRMLLLDPKSLVGKANVSREDLEKYYSDHTAEYEVKEEAQARHIFVQLAAGASEDDTKKAKLKIDQAYARVKAGEDFAKVAKDQSEDPSASSGGDLGKFAKGAMAPEFEKVVFGLKVGEISEPFRTQFGWHVAQLTAHTPGKIPTLEEVKDKVEYSAKLEKASEEARNIMRKLSTSVLPDKFAAVTDTQPEVNIHSHTVVKGKPVEGFKNSKLIEDTVFEIAPKAVSSVLEIAEGFAIVMVDSVEAPHLPAMESIRDKVVAGFVKEQARANAEQIATKLQKMVSPQKKFADAAAEEGYKAMKTPAFSRTSLGTLKAGDLNEATSEKTLNLADGEAVVIPAKDGLVVAAIASRMPVVEQATPSALQDLRRKMETARREKLYSEYLIGLRKKANDESEISLKADIDAPAAQQSR